MSDDSWWMVSLTITFYHEGVFVGPPLEYLEGNKDTMKDLDFGNFTYATALGNGGHIDVYVEHHGYDIHDWFAKDNDDLEDYDEDECVLDDISSFVEEPQFIGERKKFIQIGKRAIKLWDTKGNDYNHYWFYVVGMFVEEEVLGLGFMDAKEASFQIKTTNSRIIMVLGSLILEHWSRTSGLQGIMLERLKVIVGWVFLERTINGELLKLWDVRRNNRCSPIAVWAVVTVENKDNCYVPDMDTSGLKEAVIVDLTGILVSRVCRLLMMICMKDPAEGVSDFYSKTAWQNCYISFIKPVSGQSMWVKTRLPPPMPPKKRVMPGRPKGKKAKASKPKGKRKGGQNGFESAASALKRMRMDELRRRIADPQMQIHANADLANADHGKMFKKQIVQQLERWNQPFDMVKEPVQEVACSGTGSNSCFWKPVIEEEGTGSTAENAFDISDE
ncbi:hypothetical protein Tco_1362067 [Tanacetum coccineum]